MAVEVGRADPLEGARRPAPLGEVGALDEARARIHARRVGRGHVGRGRHPRQSRVLPEHPTAPALHRNHRKIAPERVLIVEIDRELADRQTVTRGERVEADEGREGGVGHVALDNRAPERVGAVEHDDRDAGPRADPHRQRHGPDEGVVARADILKVYDENVDAAEHRPGRRAARAVQAEHREARRRVARGADRGVILRGPPEPVLRCEEPDQTRAPQVGEERRSVSVARVDRGLVGEERHAATPKERTLLVDEHLEAGSDGGHPARRLREFTTRGSPPSGRTARAAPSTASRRSRSPH